MPSGRAPALTSRGQLLLATAGLLSLGGALSASWMLAALGLVLITLVATAWIAFFPSAMLVWRRSVEMAWSVCGGLPADGAASGPGLVSGRAFELRVTLRNRGPAPLGRVKVRVVASSAITFDDRALEKQSCLVGAHSEATLTALGRANSAGFLFLHGAAIEVIDRLGIAVLDAYFPSPLTLPVFPRSSLRVAPPRLLGQARNSLHGLRMRGLGGELRELRDHAPGDPWKQIAWRATARTGRLIVRDLERETRVTHHLLVDLAGTMRDGKAGQNKLDHAVELACAWARAAIDSGDRVGLITYEGRIHLHLPAEGGPVARRAITERLMEALTAVDEELTDVTDGELVALVARYLRHQEGIDARISRAPAIDDPNWSRNATGPGGELYDLELVKRAIEPVVESAIANAKKRRSATATAVDVEMARLRIYCRARGIELLPNRAPMRGRRAHGLALALERAARGQGARQIVLLSDLEGLEEDLDAVARAVALARRRGHRLLCMVPSVPAPGVEGAAAEILGWAERRRAAAIRRRIETLGIKVIPLAEGRSVAEGMARLGGRRRGA